MSVVKTMTKPVGGAVPSPLDGQPDQRTRDRVLGVLHYSGPATARSLADSLGVVPAAVRRHLDALLAEGRVAEHEQPQRADRGRGRPARYFTLTDLGRQGFGHTYDDLAARALRHLSRHGGEKAVERFAAEQVAELEEHCQQAMSDAGDDPVARAGALAEALSQEGYAASVSVISAGGQVCQHHCPVAHVAREFPQLCEAETAAISRLVGSHVQRLATIAHGDGVCTTYIPGATGRAVQPYGRTGTTPHTAAQAGNRTAQSRVATSKSPTGTTARRPQA